MRRAFALAAVAAAFVLPAGPAHAAPLSWGMGCDFAHVSPGFYHGRYYAHVGTSAPVVIGGATGRITCTFQTGSDTTHNGADAAARTGPTSSGVVVLPPDEVAFELDPDGGISFCAEVSIDGDRTYYYDYAAGEWSTDPGVECWTPPFFGSPPHGFGELLIGATNATGPVTDPVVCPVLASVPAFDDYEGLVYVDPDADLWVGSWLIWDCPPDEP